MPEPTTVMTAEGLKSLRSELDHLEGEGRRAIAERIKTAREWGDLKENAEYHDAKNSQSLMETRIKVLVEQLRSAVVVEHDAKSSIVTFGSVTTIRDEQTGKESTYTLVSSREANAAKGLLSMESPVATALLGHSKGDSVNVTTPRGARTFTVVNVGA